MEERVEVQTLPVIYLIPLSHFSFPFLSLVHFGCQPVSLNCISVSLQVKFSPVPSLSPSIISPIPSPFLYLFSSSFLFPSPSVSPIKTRYYTHPPNSRYSPPAPEEKAKIYKTAIFRFMCHGQKKYNHGCVERVGEAIGRDRGRNSEKKRTGEKSSGFAVEMHLRKINYLIICVCF